MDTYDHHHIHVKNSFNIIMNYGTHGFQQHRIWNSIHSPKLAKSAVKNYATFPFFVIINTIENLGKQQDPNEHLANEPWRPAVRSVYVCRQGPSRWVLKSIPAGAASPSPWTKSTNAEKLSLNKTKSRFPVKQTMSVLQMPFIWAFDHEESTQMEKAIVTITLVTKNIGILQNNNETLTTVGMST